MTDNKEHMAFEKWANNNFNCSLSKTLVNSSMYAAADAQEAWEIWQAALATRPLEPKAVCLGCGGLLLLTHYSDGSRKGRDWYCGKCGVWHILKYKCEDEDEENVLLAPRQDDVVDRTKPQHLWNDVTRELVAREQRMQQGRVGETELVEIALKSWDSVWINTDCQTDEDIKITRKKAMREVIDTIRASSPTNQGEE